MGNESSSSNNNFKPLMNEAQRGKCLEIFNNHFKTNENFLRDTVLMKLRLKGKLLKVREKILARNTSSENGNESSEASSSNAPSPTTQALLHAAPIPSFSNFADAHSMQTKQTREEKIRDGVILLRERIQNYKLHMDVMADDGNCQFRSIAYQLYGDQDGWHLKVREQIVSYMHKHASEFSFLFEDEKEFNRYLGSMARNGAWGDEICLKAASNCFNCVIHILTSEKEHYYICYKPDETSTSSPSPSSSQPSSPIKKKDQQQQQPLEIFLAYISPIHYNSLRCSSE